MTVYCRDILDVASASSLAELRSRVITIAQKSGFPGVAEWREPRAMQRARGACEISVAWGNLEALYGKRLPDYSEALGETFYKTDPTEITRRRRWEKRQSAPFLLSQLPHRFQENEAWMATRQDFGQPAYKDGLAVPIAVGSDRTNHLYLMACEDISLEQVGIGASIGSLYAFYSDLLQRSEECARSPLEQASMRSVSLKPRELEVIRWAIAGKTLNEIAQSTGLLYRTVRYHLDQARVRYGYATVQQTLVRAAQDYQLDPVDPGAFGLHSPPFAASSSQS